MKPFSFPGLTLAPISCFEQHFALMCQEYLMKCTHLLLACGHALAAKLLLAIFPIIRLILFGAGFSKLFCPN